jgi:hypothetical protein
MINARAGVLTAGPQEPGLEWNAVTVTVNASGVIVPADVYGDAVEVAQVNAFGTLDGAHRNAREH